MRAHLAPYLPNHPLQPEAGPATGVGPVSAAPWGSAGILPISWAYVRLMGGEGLKRATQVAILNANYVASPAGPALPGALHRPGRAGRARVHRRPAPDHQGRPASRVDDVAKRLIDYGFHAPTMSFPVAGTLMIEPTESEDLAELDRFCEAMIAIRGEIERVGSGEWTPTDNPLRNAPHTAAALARRVGARLQPGRGGLPGRGVPGRRSTGRRCAGSTAPTATATSSAPARRWTRTTTDRMTRITVAVTADMPRGRVTGASSGAGPSVPAAQAGGHAWPDVQRAVRVR